MGVIDDLRDRLAVDTPFFAEGCVKIVAKSGREVALVGKAPQLRYDAALEAQHAAGKPMRAIVVKARQVGYSTWTQAKMVQRATRLPNWNGITIAHDVKTAGQLYDMAAYMHGHLPDDPGLGIKPSLGGTRKGRHLLFAEAARDARRRGLFGLNSSLTYDTAAEFDAGRGFTYRGVHCSEAAFWPDLERKLNALLDAVPDEPGTLVALESTPNGFNEFKDRWDDAVAGKGDFIPVFAAWWEEPDYRREFASPVDRERWMESEFGHGSEGEDEPMLAEQFGCTPEQLMWRRAKIAQKNGDIRKFNQEFPYAPEVGFLSTGKQVFSSIYVTRTIAEAAAAAEPEAGALTGEKKLTKRSAHGTVEVPQAASWRRERDRMTWDVWEHPTQEGVRKDVHGKEQRVPPGAYVLVCDPASGEDDPDLAMHAVTVWDHRTRRQVAQLECQVDPDLLGMELLVAALYWNKARLVIERTGGWGLSMLRAIHFDYVYPWLYKSKSIGTKAEREQDRLGWETGQANRRAMIDNFNGLLRTGEHGVRSVGLARQLPTFVRNGRREEPEKGKRSDLLMTAMIAHYVMDELPVLDRKALSGPTSTSTRRTLSRVAGY